MIKNNLIIVDKYLNSTKKIFNHNKNNFRFVNGKKDILILLFFLYLLLYVSRVEIKRAPLMKLEEKFYFDKYEVFAYNRIKQKLIDNQCSEMWDNQREFLNGVVRKFKPRKILEIGVRHGGSSLVILNAINDFEYSKLYSIDLSSEEDVGNCVKNYFPNFMKNWILFKGNIATKFIEKIGFNIDLLLIDTAHFEPGEILDFLIVLPFLKQNAVVIFHDIANQITRSTNRNEWAPYIIFNGIRGVKFLPSGNKILTHDIGAIQLENNQTKYYHDYFRLLGGQWQYFPKENHINQIRKHFKKYYDKDCLFMFEETIRFNRNFVKLNPKELIYRYNSD